MRPLTAPTLSLAGACLRSWRLGDAPQLVSAWNDADIAAWNQVPPEPTLATAQRWISNEQGRLDRRLSIDLAIDVEGKGVAGEVGLSSFSADGRGALIGYWLLPGGRGQGLATDAVIALRDWAYTNLDIQVIVAQCAPANHTSHHVAERAGFAREAHDAAGNELWRHRRRIKD